MYLVFVINIIHFRGQMKTWGTEIPEIDRQIFFF